MSQEVLRYSPTVRAAKAATARYWRPVREDEVTQEAARIDAIYERAVGLHAIKDEAVRPLLEAQLPSVEVRRVVTRAYLTTARALQEVANLDFRLWWWIAAPVMSPWWPETVPVKRVGPWQLPEAHQPKASPLPAKRIRRA